jgi:hypothetical protein
MHSRMDIYRDRHRNEGIMSMLKNTYTALLLFLLMALPPSFAAAAQSDRPRLQITEIDIARFPEISFHLVYLDADNRVILDMSELKLLENGRSVGDFKAEPVDVGTELIVVIDANTSIEQQDEAGGSTRREKVRDSIIRYANLFMNPMQLDSMTMIVPEGDGGRFLDEAGLTFPNEVINAINFYETGDLHEPNLNGLMNMALEQAASTRDEGRFQAILLFSDAGNISERLDFDSLVETARDGQVAIYSGILGSRADADEIEQVTRLTEPTGGAYTHMPNPVRTDELYELLQQRANEARIDYRSSIDSSGVHTLSTEIAGVLAEESFELVVEPPVVRMAVDNSRPIRRVASEPDISFEQMEPTHQPLVAEVAWPDEHPRILDSAILLVNGQEMPVQNTILGDDGLLTFDWDIRFLDEGIYDLQVQVTDELGLQSTSEPLPLAIEVDRIQPIPTTPPPTLPPPEPTSAPSSESGIISFSVIAIGGVALILLLFLVLLVTGIILFRRRRSDGTPEQASPSQPATTAGPMAVQLPPDTQTDPAMTYALPPEFAAVGLIGALLEAIENAPDHPTMIPIGGNNVALGRDAKRVQIAFQDQSVSRLHARILENQGLYRIYDEGSSSGTYVNYKRIGLSPQTLNDKDIIHLGRVQLRFHLASAYRTNQATGSETEIYETPQ